MRTVIHALMAADWFSVAELVVVVHSFTKLVVELCDPAKHVRLAPQHVLLLAQQALIRAFSVLFSALCCAVHLCVCVCVSRHHFVSESACLPACRSVSAFAYIPILMHARLNHLSWKAPCVGYCIACTAATRA